ncbi:hypothetical protein HRbin19_01462 [bacterium HR19]|nr:hypothetical protein HRbin19_01462 [bacterium HR19]
MNRIIKEKIWLGIIAGTLITGTLILCGKEEGKIGFRKLATGIKSRLLPKGTTVSGQLPKGGKIFLRSELGMGAMENIC